MDLPGTPHLSLDYEARSSLRLIAIHSFREDQPRSFVFVKATCANRSIT